MTWNPAGPDAAIEYALLEEDPEAFLEKTRQASIMAYRPYQIACLLRNIGCYCARKECFEDALACYHRSLLFEKDNESAHRSIEQIQEISGSREELCTMERALEIEEKYQVFLGPNPELVEMLRHSGDWFREKGMSAEANYFYRILFELTDDPEALDRVDAAAPYFDPLYRIAETPRPMPGKLFGIICRELERMQTGDGTLLLRFGWRREDDDVTSLRIGRTEGGLGLVIEQDMYEYGWEHPLWLGCSDIPEDTAKDILADLAMDCTDPIDIEYVFNRFRSLEDKWF